MLGALLIVAAAALPCAVAAQEPHGAAEAAAPHEESAPHGMTPLQSVAKLANFAILAGVLVYFLKSPLAGYLASRATQIRQDLVTASEMRAAATARLAEIERRLQTLPAELERLKAQGEEDLRAEQVRLAQAAAAERERLLDQTRREIATRLRVARRELTEDAARLAIEVAERRIKQSITPEDQLRLVDRYTAQLQEAR
ncbi:MAG TPA: ATP synthase F0 subunit B [Thermoanaerobaculia bacterium]|nr:ATP synthase F0 subunit B [Thermoanaerobaculia bacterium]